MSAQPPYEPPPGPPTPPAPPYGYGAPAPRPNASSAVTALVLGILGVVTCGPFTSIPAIIVGRNAVREVDASQGQLGGREMAQAGFVLGIVMTVLYGLALLLVIVVFVFGAVISSSFQSTCSTITDDTGSQTVRCD
jgi:hypothetical protein